jgi:electron-transferring-flavoprotein dehydrogenase
MLRCKRLVLRRSARLFHTSPKALNEVFNSSQVERPEDEVDICIVGGGPAGLSAAIRLKQLEKEKGKDIRVVVLEKGSEIGMCVLS